MCALAERPLACACFCTEKAKPVSNLESSKTDEVQCILLQIEPGYEYPGSTARIVDRLERTGHPIDGFPLQ